MHHKNASDIYAIYSLLLLSEVTTFLLLLSNRTSHFDHKITKNDWLTSYSILLFLESEINCYETLQILLLMNIIGSNYSSTHENSLHPKLLYYCKCSWSNEKCYETACIATQRYAYSLYLSSYKRKITVRGLGSVYCSIEVKCS